MVRLTLMYYIDFISFMENPDKAWLEITGKKVQKTAALFRQTFMGMSYEESFFDGLNVNTLKENFEYLYAMIKA